MKFSSRVVLYLVCGRLASASAASPDTTFTYQGRLTESGAPYTGNAEFLPTLWDAASGGAQVAINNPAILAVGITNGLFILPLDFATNFPGADRWLQLGVRTGAGDFTLLAPRQKITAVPYAQTATVVTGSLPASQLSGTLASANLAGTYANAVTFNHANNSLSGNGAGLTGLNASQLTAGTVPEERLGTSIARTSQVWQLGGNAGTSATSDFLGTTDRQPLVLRSGNREVLRLTGTAEGVRLVGGVDNSIHATSTNSAILGGDSNTIATNAPASVITGGRHNRIQTDQRAAFIGGGSYNTIDIDNQNAVIVGGRDNRIGTNCLISAILGGAENTIRNNVDYGLIAGGYGNDIEGSPNPNNRQVGSAIFSGNRQRIENSDHAIIVGGRWHSIGTNSANAFIGGGGYGVFGGYTATGNLIHNNSGCSTITGGGSHRILSDSIYASIGGGYHANIGSNCSSATIAGGYNNDIGDHSPYASILGGRYNNISSNCPCSTISGGTNNNISLYSSAASIVGGSDNSITNSCDFSTIGGGRANTTLRGATYATIPGGRDNVAGEYAFAAGRRAKANHYGAFVWGDAVNIDMASSANNQFTARASGGVRFFSNTAATSGVKLDSGDNSWSSVSDQNLKKDRTAVNTQQVLNKLATVPVERWRYQWEDETSTPHMGPMAQDFKAAFYPGRDDRSISTMEFDGVALAAIQGLNQKLEETRKENAELKRRLERLESLLEQSVRAAVGGAR